MARARRRSECGLFLAATVMLWAPAAATAEDELPKHVREMLKRIMMGDVEEEDQPQSDPRRDRPRPAPRDPGRPVSLDEAEVEVSPAGTISLNVVDLPLATVLRVLSLQTRRNIITTPAVQGTVTASLHDVTFEEALDAILLANQAAYRTVGNFIYVYTREELADILATEDPPVSEVFRLNYISAIDIEPALTPLLSPIGRMSISTAPVSGIAATAEDGGGASLASSDYVVVYDRRENVDTIAAVVRDLDVRPRQVLVEATILSAELNDDNALGVDFTVLGGVDLELLGSSSRAIQDVSVGDLPTARFEKFNSNISTDFNSNVPNGGVSIGIIKDHVAVFVRALERVTDTVVLANPKVLALNKQKGQVIVGRRDGYITTTVTETQAIQTVEFLETGTQLLFRPFIGDDGFVRMELHPEDSVGGLNASNLPFEQTTEVTTNVIVKDGQTILIGGLFREVDSDTRSQVPLFGDIPVLGQIFRSRNDSLRRQEVIILLTVHVVQDHDAYAKESWDQYQDVERLRVGLREGQMWFGRERIAQELYKQAVEAHARGDEEDALWHVRMALHNNPRFLPAVKLQEELRGGRRWEDEGVSTRDFIRRAMMREMGAEPAPPYGRPVAPEGVEDAIRVSDWTEEHREELMEEQRDGK